MFNPYIAGNPDRAQKIISACCHLHNYLMKTSTLSTCPTAFADKYDANGCLVEGEWRSKWFPLQPKSGRQSEQAKIVRDSIKDYVNSAEGQVSW